MKSGESMTVEFAVSDPAALGSLTSRIGSLSSLVVRRRGEAARAYELGAADVLTVVGGSAALVDAVNLLPDFLGSRRAGVKVRVTVGEREVEVQSGNAADTVRLLEQILGGEADDRSGIADQAVGAVQMYGPQRDQLERDITPAL